MNREEQMLCRHLMDLAETCYRRDIPIFSDFLSLYEQSLFHQYVAGGLPPVDFCLDGGYEYAERKILAFEPAGAGYHIPASFCALEILPLQAKFSEDLTHRDYLGALIHLGLDRSGIGDILPMEMCIRDRCGDRRHGDCFSYRLPYLAERLCVDLFIESGASGRNAVSGEGGRRCNTLDCPAGCGTDTAVRVFQTGDRIIFRSVVCKI